MAVDWRAAYLKQAYSDFEVAKVLMTEAAAGRVARCHMLHYLQMALEKLRKAIESSVVDQTFRTHTKVPAISSGS